MFHFSSNIKKYSNSKKKREKNVNEIFNILYIFK